jgi:DNA (cytosine-5)-methyltransferase 1
MTLYEEIVFLQYHSKALWLVENVVPYYPPLIPAKKINRHLYWSNFDLPDYEPLVEDLRRIQIPELEKLHGFDLSKYKLPNKRQVLRNCVNPAVGLRLLQAALDSTEKKGNSDTQHPH